MEGADRQDTGEPRPGGPRGAVVAGAPPAHEHRTVGSDHRLWLEAIHDQAASMRLHGYCVDCGAVRSMLPMRGRPTGYFAQALANLKADLEDNPKHAKLAQVHGHLIQRALDAIPDFDDPYSMDFETQRSIFVGAVQRYRPDLDLEFLERAMPREPRRARPAYIDLIASAQKEEKGQTVRT